MHFDNLLFLLLVLVAMFLRVLASAAKKASKSSTPTQRRSTATPPLPRAPIESDAERIRKFLEALGQPAGAGAPPPVTHRTELPPRPLAPVQAPREMVAGPLPQRRRAAKRIQLPGQITTSPSVSETARPQTSAPVYEVQQTPAPPPEPLPPLVVTPAAAYAAATKPVIAPVERAIDVRVMLASASGLRDAVILREIFGPPRSLQPLELIGT